MTCPHTTDPHKGDPRRCSLCLGVAPTVTRKLGTLPAGAELIDIDELVEVTGYDGAIGDWAGQARRGAARRHGQPCEPSQREPAPADHYTTTDAARLARVRVSTVHDAIKRGELVPRRQGSLVYFPKAAVERWAAAYDRQRRESRNARQRGERSADVRPELSEARRRAAQARWDRYRSQTAPATADTNDRVASADATTEAAS